MGQFLPISYNSEPAADKMRLDRLRYQKNAAYILLLFPVPKSIMMCLLLPSVSAAEHGVSYKCS